MLLIKTYDDYLQALKETPTEMFWWVPDDVEVVDSFKFDIYFSYDNEYDRHMNHVFLNGEHYDGIVLFSKHRPVSKKEFAHRFLIERKEWNIVASVPRPFDRFQLETYDDYRDALEKTSTEMFWGIWPNVDIIDENVFDLYFSHHNRYDRNENHVFLNACDRSTSYLNGIVLFTKHKPISRREFERKYLVDKKEHDLIVSRYRYPKMNLIDYDTYVDYIAKTDSPLFWGIWSNVDITNENIFDFYYDPNDGKYDHDRNENHVFKHLFRNSYTYTNGIVLLSKNKKITEKEFVHRFLIEKKEHDILASKTKPYDIVFISYNEPNAEENFTKLSERFPRARRVHGIKGIHQAHIRAAESCSTEMFWVVDGDAVIDESFEFDHEVSTYERETVHVWRSRNPVNGLIYGYGGVKLLPRHLTLSMDLNSADMTTSISKWFKSINTVSNITEFNTDPFNTWKSAFRECVKLSSRSISRQEEEETRQRLEIWTTVGEEKPFGKYSIMGAKMGKDYGIKYFRDLDRLQLINNFDWLKQIYDEI
jgi:hypothetical protein